jgi:hypothetical protein
MKASGWLKPTDPAYVSSPRTYPESTVSVVCHTAWQVLDPFAQRFARACTDDSSHNAQIP